MVKHRKSKNNSNKNSRQIIIALLFCLFIFSAGFIWQLLNTDSGNAISSYQGCVDAGNPIMESYPEQCSANGKTFTNPKQNAEDLPLTISQGVKGIIKLRSGDCMPSTDQKNSNCKTEIYDKPIEVIIKKSKDLNNKQDKEIVKKLDGVKGIFESELEPGIYSMYVMYKGQEYCNSFGGQKGEDCEFMVSAGQVVSYTLKINEATD